VPAVNHNRHLGDQQRSQDNQWGNAETYKYPSAHIE
jgi:hypothetical protein